MSGNSRDRGPFELQFECATCLLCCFAGKTKVAVLGHSGVL